MFKIKFLRSVATSGLLAAALTFTTAAVAADKNKNAYQGSDVAHVTKEVRHELLMLPYYNVFDNLSFKVDPGGVVTLLGQVTTPTLKSDAGNVVKKVEGVTAVNNQIEVLPLSPNDNQIRRAVARAIYGNTALADRYGFQAMPSIHIIVKNGNATLVGWVSTEGDKTIADLAAKGVPNVFSVKNELGVEK